MRWSESLEKQAETLEFISRSKEVNREIDKLTKLLQAVKGFHYFSGVGKNGHVAAHLASTFNSLGIRSMFVDPVNTLHGDMNIFSNKDMVIAISKSGETDELITFMKALRRIDFKNTVAITSSPNSSLAKLASESVVIPIKSEGDSLGIAPIASTLAYMAVLQAVAVQISSERGLTKKEFVRSHPGGSIGRRRV